ncbi:hypothetical protein ABIC65_001062 [Sphingomonas trueperi]|uniref:hypothetical protein n=1 Tax=Sphingomonas trueperi TaxID=53317 RepID=UPI0033977DFB
MSSRKPRPAPEDFVEMAKTMTHKQLVKHYGSSSGTVSRWRLETGAKKHAGREMRAIPDDFRANAKTMTWKDLRDHYHASNEVLQRWRILSGVRLEKAARPLTPPPAGFRQAATVMLRTQLATHYHVSKGMIDRWLRETGLQALGRVQAEARVVHAIGAPKLAAVPNNRDMSLAGRAADFLQKRAAIFRCDANGRFQLGGTHWKWRGKAHTAAEIIAEACERGFEPDAWKEIAA